MALTPTTKAKRLDSLGRKIEKLEARLAKAEQTAVLAAADLDTAVAELAWLTGAPTRRIEAVEDETEVEAESGELIDA